MTFPLLLAHGGAGGDWHGVATIAAGGALVVFVLAVLGRVSLESGGDLVLPLAAIAIVSGVGGSLGGVVGSQAAWAIPVGIVLLLAVILAAVTPLSLTPTSPLTIGAAVVAIVAGVALYGPMSEALEPDTAPTPTATATPTP